MDIALTLGILIVALIAGIIGSMFGLGGDHYCSALTLALGLDMKDVIWS